jgi:hypothetical protein
MARSARYRSRVPRILDVEVQEGVQTMRLRLE